MFATPAIERIGGIMENVLANILAQSPRLSGNSKSSHSKFLLYEELRN